MDEAAGETRAWGYPFDVQTRWSFYPAGTPNVVVTSFSGMALLESARELGIDAYRRRSEAAAKWVLESLHDRSTGIFTYHAGSDALIHNANLLGARFVWRALPDLTLARDAVKRALERTLAAQRPDGSWPYGEGPGLEFCDGFHTGFILECLADLRPLDPRIDEAFGLGSRFYVERFFGADGAARLWPGRDYPQDGHSAGTGLTTLSAMLKARTVQRETVELCLDHAVTRMVHRGRAVFRRYRRGRSRVGYIRWSDAHMALGLANAALALGEPREPACAPRLTGSSETARVRT